MKRRAGIVMLWVFVVAVGFAIDGRYEQMVRESQGPRDSSDVLLDAVGEFRTVLARYLWFKMDLYHEVLEGTKATQAQQDQILPLLRMVSLLDPTITDSYDLMAWEMAKSHNDPEQALALLAEGLKKNPESWPLRFRESLINYEHQHFEAALKSSQLAAPLATAEFDQLNSYRVMYWSAKKLRSRDAMREALSHLRALRPQDPLWLREQTALGSYPLTPADHEQQHNHDH